MPGLADRAGHASLAGGAKGCTFSGATIQGTVCTRHFPKPRCHSANRFTRACMPLFCGTTSTQTASWKGTFSRMALRRAVALLGEQAGLWWRSTTWGTSGQLLVGQCQATCCRGRPRAIARTALPPRQATPPWTAHVAHRLRRYHRDRQWAQVQSPALRVPEHTSGAGFWFPTTKSKQSRSRATTWRGRTSHLFIKRRNDCADIFAKTRADTHTSLLFWSPRQLLLVPPWPSKRRDGRPRPRLAQVQWLQRHQGCRAKSTDTATACAAPAQAKGGDRCARLGEDNCPKLLPSQPRHPKLSDTL